MSEFLHKYHGMLWAVREWTDWETLMARLVSQSAGWYAYFVGMEVPEKPLTEAEFQRLLTEMDLLLRRDHRERYLGIVYVDDRAHPQLIKIYDPNNLGASCGSSGKQIPPGWILSKLVPEALPAPAVIPEGRRRWWQTLIHP